LLLDQALKKLDCLLAIPLRFARQIERRGLPVDLACSPIISGYKFP
jgi:hypothetical protein